MGTALDKIREIFRGGPDNWEERLAGSIKFVSPDNNSFDAKWIGSPRSVDKKLAVFEYPKVKGSVVQDLDVTSNRYDITFFFDGDNNDKISNAFFAAMKQTGKWEVIHPIHGFLGLQPVTVTVNDEPINSGGVTEINSSWIEPIDSVTLETDREAKGIVDALNNDLNLNAAEQFAANVRTATDKLKGAIETTTNGIQNLTDFALDPVKSTTDSIDDAFNSVQQGIQQTLDATVFQPLQLAGQIQQLIQLPLYATSDVKARLKAYGELATSYFSLLPGSLNNTVPDSATTDEFRNTVVTTELALSATIGSLGLIATTGSLDTRNEVIGVIEDIISLSTEITDQLDTVQKDFQILTIDRQYFSQTITFSTAQLLLSKAFRYLLLTLFDLKVEKRFVLGAPRAPIEITISEYGSLGENDVFFDLFLGSNNLLDNDILLLPPGKEVVVYI
jgi:hypothetical protein